MFVYVCVCVFLKGTFFINFLFKTVLCNVQASRIYMQEECLSSLFIMINHAWKKHPFWMLHMSCYVVFLVLLFFFVQLNVKEVAFLKFHSIVILRIFTFCLFIFLCVFLIFFRIGVIFELLSTAQMDLSNFWASNCQLFDEIRFN